MKRLSILPFSLFIAVCVAMPAAFAQQTDVDTNRMNRDINIMENILEEMFKTSTRNSGASGAYVFGEDLFLRSSRGIRGTHLPGYGVIFTIPYRIGPHIIGLRDESGGQTTYEYRFEYESDNANSTDITEESIVERINEFLRDYGSTIGQLGSQDHVMVVFGANRSNRSSRVFAFGGDESSRKDPIPTISVAARKQDLDAYRSGRITEQQLQDRLTVAKASESDQKQLDMQVMANIFETAFKQSDGKGFRINGSVSHLKLDNFGALFFFDVSYFDRDPRFFVPTAPRISIWSDSGEENENEEEERVEITQEIRRETEQMEKEQKQRMAERNEAINAAYTSLKNQLKEIIVDYGRTISSIETDQHLMVSVSLSGSGDELPGRLEMRVPKSVLQAMDRGNISREDAMAEVMVTEY